MGQEEVHGGVEVRVRDNGQADGDVPHHSDQVHAQEDAKEKRLLFLVLRQAQEEEFRDTECFLVSSHWCKLRNKMKDDASETFLDFILSKCKQKHKINMESGY